jgi:hypothetical protein
MNSGTDLSGFQCCFCANSIASSDTDPVVIVISLQGGGTQELYAHAKCLQVAVHPSTPLAVGDA